MPVFLISDTERLAFTMHGVTFYYRRLSAHENQKIYEKCTDRRRGSTNFVQYNLERIKTSALGWEGEMYDAQGQPLRFDPKYIDYLPEDVRNEWVNKLEEGDPGLSVAERQKNFNMSSVHE